MDMERIIGCLFSGFMTKVYAAGLALWVASEACAYIGKAFSQVGSALGG